LQAELGVRNVLLVGTAGGRLPDQSPGNLIFPSAAVRADGTSDHYAAPGEAAVPDAALAAEFEAFLIAAGLAGERAPCWTTGAAFRTTAEEVGFYAARGVRAVEEEVAAVFTVGAARQVRTAAALVLDGVPTAEGGWHLDLGTAQQRLQALFGATVEFAATVGDN
jgi:uridine phosphorylase